MLKSKKLKRKQLEKIKTEILKEKKELEMIKAILEEKCPKIDITNVYVFTYGKISYLVNLEKDKNRYNLKDIFSGNIIFSFDSIIKTGNKFSMALTSYFNQKDEYAYLTPILEANSEFIVYVNKQVPSYVLQQYLYRLNDIDIFNQRKSK